MHILGLDISTNTTGFCLISTNPHKLLAAGAIEFKDCNDLYEKADKAKQKLCELALEFQIDKIYVEQSLQAFRGGRSSAKTLFTLSRFNGMICYVIFELLELRCNLINVISARSRLGYKIKKDEEKSTKQQILEKVSANILFEEFVWPQKTLKSGPRKGKTIPDPCCFDIADAAVMAMYGCKIEQ